MHDPTPRTAPFTPGGNSGFDEVIDSAIPEAPCRFRSFAHLLFTDEPPDAGDRTVILGSVEHTHAEVTLNELRHAVLAMIPRVEALGARAGDTVCLLRLPHTSELLIAITYVALSVMRVRVLLPMFVDPERVGLWLRASGAKLLLRNAREVIDQLNIEADRTLLEEVDRRAAEASVTACCIQSDLRVDEALRISGNERDESMVRALVDEGSLDDPCLLLTTSGTSGRSKMVVYTQGAFLRSCGAWERAGLFGADRLGGRGFCPLFAHSMGVRALWNALYTRSPLCLVPPEWFAEHPERARAFLARMRPEHVTGGPGVFRSLLELARVFPSLKDELAALRCLVSSGAPFDQELDQKLARAIDQRLENALGLTETQQVLSTAVAEPSITRGPDLGNPLPGVRLGLRIVSGDAARLFVSSPFAAEGYLDEQGELQPLPGPPGWFDTGDLVERTATGIRYIGRDASDFFKDGFGVKIPRARVVDLYADLGPPILHVEPFGLRDEPGLGALIFVAAADADAPPSLVEDMVTVRRVRGLLMARLERLRDEVEEFEFRHLTISRFACVQGPLIRTPKGEIARSELLARHEEVIRSLAGRYTPGPGHEQVPRDGFGRNRTARLIAPRRGELLRIARMDQHFEAAQGDTLTYHHRGRAIDVIDFVGGFGGNLLGHRHPAVVDAMRHFLEGSQPGIGDQGSGQQAAGHLARALALAVSKHTGATYVVRLGSTGSEAVEMAIAHAQLERAERLERFHRKLRQSFGSIDPARVRDCVAEGARAFNEHIPALIVMSSSFHGHSLAARSALGSDKHRRHIASLARLERIVVSPDTSVEEVRHRIAESRFELPSLALEDGKLVATTVSYSRVVAAIAEPVLGEGGVREAPTALLQALVNDDFPLVIDEIQCGLGRTGTFLASQGTVGHYYLFAKALGGGFAKVSALLIERQRYVEKFDECYASTFAGDPWSSTVGLAVLDIIEREDIPGRAAAKGRALRDALERVREAYPEVFASVRGRGLMLGIELDPRCGSSSVMLRGLALHDHLGALAASALLYRHQVRILPTLSAPNTLRIEPSASIDSASIAQLEHALLWLGECLRHADVAQIASHLADDEDEDESVAPDPVRANSIVTRVEAPAKDAARVGFINHFVVPERELALAEPSLRALPSAKRRALFHRFMELMELEPMIGFGRNILRERTWFLSVVNVADTATLESLHRSQDRQGAVDRIQRAVDLAASHGCTTIALGAYSSIIAQNGLAILPPDGARITSGNTLTVAVAARRILHACSVAGIEPGASSTILGIVGAAGNIGAALSHRLLLGPGSFRRAVLVSRTPRHFARLRSRLKHSQADITFTDDLGRLSACNVIALAVNTNEPLLLPHHVGKQLTVIGDVSVPGSVSRSVRGAEQVRYLTLAGVVALPGEPDFVMSSHSPPGTAFCCAAEAMLIGMEPDAAKGLTLVGDVDPHAVAVLDGLAEKHAWLDPVAAPQHPRAKR